VIDPKALTAEELSSKDFSSYDPNAEGKLLKVSKSSFIAYDSCPRKYWWEKVQLQDIRLPANEYMIHGSEVHTNLETIYDNWEGQSTLAPLIPAEQHNKSNDNLVFLEECRIAKWGLEHFMPVEYEEYRAVWDEENQCVLVGLIDGILVHPDGGLCIYELKTGSWGSTKMSKTRKELCYYKRMLELMGETRPITHFAYIAPDASNDKYVAELCGWKDDSGRWDEDRVATSKAGWLDSNSKRDVAIGSGGEGLLIIEKVNKRSITSFEKALTQSVAGIKTHDWPMKWNDYFCPAWCDFAMSCESENNGIDNLWGDDDWM
tara:strand:- start:3969 stop:4922 length:954 start_codon:yes stop_codon:yes gene_type:complete